MQWGQSRDCPNTDTQGVSCEPGLVCTDVAIICLRGGEGVQRWKHLVVQFLILYLSCNLSSHSGPNEHTSGIQDNHSVEAIFYQWDFHSSRPQTFLAAIISNYCLCVKIWTIQNEEPLAILLRGTLLTRTHWKWELYWGWVFVQVLNQSHFSTYRTNKQNFNFLVSTDCSKVAQG